MRYEIPTKFDRILVSELEPGEGFTLAGYDETPYVKLAGDYYLTIQHAGGRIEKQLNCIDLSNNKLTSIHNDSLVGRRFKNPRIVLE